MLKHPLHTAYLAAGNPQSCIVELKEGLKNLHADRSETLRLDAVIKDKLLIADAHELSRRGRKQAGDNVWCLLRGFSRTSNETQNAVLKILEEPADGTHFFFVTPSPSQLLETVRSRMTSKDICSNGFDSTGYVNEFLQADTLPERLSVAETVVDEGVLREFITGLEKSVSDSKGGNTLLRQALVTVAPWLEDVGRSDSQIAEFLAVAAEKEDVQ